MNRCIDRIYDNIKKIIMYISSYFPLYIMIIVLNFSRFSRVFYDIKIFLIFFILLLLLVVSIISIVLLKLGRGSKEKSIDNIENPDDAVLSYIMTYMIPIISNGNNSTEIIIVNILLFLLIGYIYLRLNLIFLNPLWALFGYMIYKDDKKEIIITNISRLELKHKRMLTGYYLSNGIFVAHKNNN